MAVEVLLTKLHAQNTKNPKCSNLLLEPTHRHPHAEAENGPLYDNNVTHSNSVSQLLPAGSYEQ